MQITELVQGMRSPTSKDYCIRNRCIYAGGIFLIQNQTWTLILMILFFVIGLSGSTTNNLVQDLNDSDSAASKPFGEFDEALNSIAANLFTALKIAVFTLLLLTIIFIFKKIYTQKGIVILPFETEQNANISGAAIADQLTAELVRIQQIHSAKFEDLTLIPNTCKSSFVSKCSTETLLSNSQAIVPKAEIVELNLVDIGDINMGFCSLSIGKLIIAFKGLCPGSKPVTTIRGSLQRYGPTNVLVVILESRTIQSWMHNSEEQIHEMIKNLAAMITHGLHQSGVSAKSWEGLKHYTNALDAYHQYNLSRNPNVLSIASEYSLDAIRVEKRYKNPYDLLSLLEFVYIDIGRPNDAAEYCSKTIELDPSSPYAWYNKGRILAYLGRTNNALQAYNEAIRLDPNFADAWSNKGLALLEIGKHDEALQACDEAIGLDPTISKAWNNKGNALFKLGKDDEALQAYDEAIRLDPNFAYTWYNKGNVLLTSGKDDKALQAYDEAIRLDPNFAYTWYNKGNVLFKLGKHDEALQAYDEAIKLDPNFAYIWNNKGNVLFKLGKHDEALQAYDEAIRLDPNFAPAWSHKGNALKQLGRTKEADAAFAKAMELGFKAQ